ncbi:MAG: hypothetical protein RBU25_17125 [Lentisphaeria bacterium]|nr:hypothetical protein [Lentisphaeria bacterium]
MTDNSGGCVRQVLTGVPRVGFYPDMCGHAPGRGPEDIIFPACMRAVMEYLGHPEYDYIHFVGVTGAGFFLNWKDGWHGDNPAIYYMAPVAEHMKLFQYAFDSTGYPGECVLLKGEAAVGEAEARRRIIASIGAGLPLLAHGVVGPPETCLVTGYDEGGDVLIGWSFFQSHDPWTQGVEFEPNGMFRKRDWYRNTWDLQMVGGRGAATDPPLVRRQSLEWAVKVVRTPETWGGRHNGLAAYDAWAAHLLRDGDITPDGTVPAGVRDMPFGVHDDAVGTVAESRYYVSEYLLRLARAEPKMRTALLKGAGCYSREHDLMWQVWDCCGGNGRTPEHVRRFADPAARRRIAELVQEAKREDEQAIRHIEAALAASR